MLVRVFLVTVFGRQLLHISHGILLNRMSFLSALGLTAVTHPLAVQLSAMASFRRALFAFFATYSVVSPHAPLAAACVIHVLGAGGVAALSLPLVLVASHVVAD